MPNEKADTTTYESESPQRGRYQHVWGQICRPAAETAREGGVDRRGTCGIDRNTESDALPLGMRGQMPRERAGIPCNGRSENQAFPSFGRPEKIISDKIYQTVDTPLATILPFGRISPVINVAGVLTFSGQAFCRSLFPQRYHKQANGGRHFYVSP